MSTGFFIVRDSSTVKGGYALTLKINEAIVRQRKKMTPGNLFFLGCMGVWDGISVLFKFHYIFFVYLLSVITSINNVSILFH